MSRPPPTSDQQVRFLVKLQRLLTEGSFVASYKFALLHALADLAVLRGDDTGDELTLSIGDIAEQFVRLYWAAADEYPDAGTVLMQSTDRQAKVISLLARARAKGEGASLGRFRRRGRAWGALVRKVERVVREQPLDRLQTVGSVSLDFLYESALGNRDPEGGVTLMPGVSYCLRRFHGLVTELVRAAWIGHVRRTNADVLGETCDLATFLFGSERGELSPHAQILADMEGDICFYCRGALKRERAVDHFIPWARFSVDLGHNFVLAHPDCNAAKSDALAAICHLQRWCERNERLGTRMAQRCDELGIVHDLGASLRVASWAYAQAESTGSLLWIARRAPPVAVDVGWRLLVGMTTLPTSAA